MAKVKVLVVDDDINICEMLKLYLVKEGYEVVIANNGAIGLDKFKSCSPDIVLLDIMLPKKDGWEVCQKIREVSNIPIIMVTAKGQTFDKVLGLELGADDFLVKPFDMKELIARVKAVLRRSSSATMNEQDEIVVIDNMEISKLKYELKIDGKIVDISPRELLLLHFLAGHPNKVFTRDQLLDKVWGFDYFGDTRTVDVHIKRLRECLDGVSNKWNIKTVWGVGYKFEYVVK